MQPISFTTADLVICNVISKEERKEALIKVPWKVTVMGLLTLSFTM